MIPKDLFLVGVPVEILKASHQGAVFFFFLFLSLPSSTIQWHHEGGNFFSEYDRSNWLFYVGYYLAMSSSLLYIQELITYFLIPFYLRKDKANWIGHILRRYCLLHNAIEGQMTEVKGIGRRRTQLLDG